MKLTNFSVVKELQSGSCFQTLYQKLNDAVAICDYSTGDIKECNNATLSLLNYSKEEILQLKYFDILPKFSSLFPNIDLHAFVKKDHVTKVMNGKEISILGELITKERKSVFAEFHIIPFQEKKGYAFIVLKNITDKVENERKLVSTEKRYKTIFNNACESILYFDLKTSKCIECNDVVKEMFGVASIATFLETPTERFYCTENKDVNSTPLKEFFKKNIKEIKTNGSSCTIFQAKKLSGEKFIAEITSVIKDEGGEYPRLISFIKDITKQYYAQKERDQNFTDLMESKEETKRNAAELDRKNKELKKYIESNSQLENFAAIASHDLQAPLRTIHSYTQLLHRSLKDKATADQKDFMHFITNATGNMRHLIRDLRAFSKVDSTKLNVRTINVGEMLEEVLRELQVTIDHQKAMISVTENMPTIDGDRIKLRQLFQNLITNALKYIGKDTIPNVHISFEDQKECWCFKIKDNGIGIASEYQEKIFQLFQRLHTKEDYVGTGIGLSLCKKVVDQHLGKIGVDSEEGKGSTFYFTIHKEVTAKLAEFNE